MFPEIRLTAWSILCVSVSSVGTTVGISKALKLEISSKSLPSIELSRLGVHGECMVPFCNICIYCITELLYIDLIFGKENYPFFSCLSRKSRIKPVLV